MIEINMDEMINYISQQLPGVDKRVIIQVLDKEEDFLRIKGVILEVK